jgi:hypothetical protein
VPLPHPGGLAMRVLDSIKMLLVALCAMPAFAQPWAEN